MHSSTSTLPYFHTTFGIPSNPLAFPFFKLFIICLSFFLLIFFYLSSFFFFLLSTLSTSPSLKYFFHVLISMSSIILFPFFFFVHNFPHFFLFPSTALFHLLFSSFFLLLLSSLYSLFILLYSCSFPLSPFYFLSFLLTFFFFSIHSTPPSSFPFFCSTQMFPPVPFLSLLILSFLSICFHPSFISFSPNFIPFIFSLNLLYSSSFHILHCSFTTVSFFFSLSFSFSFCPYLHRLMIWLYIFPILIFLILSFTPSSPTT